MKRMEDAKAEQFAPKTKRKKIKRRPRSAISLGPENENMVINIFNYQDSARSSKFSSKKEIPSIFDLEKGLKAEYGQRYSIIEPVKQPAAETLHVKKPKIAEKRTMKINKVMINPQEIQDKSKASETNIHPGTIHQRKYVKVRSKSNPFEKPQVRPKSALLAVGNSVPINDSPKKPKKTGIQPIFKKSKFRVTPKKETPKLATTLAKTSSSKFEDFQILRMMKPKKTIFSKVVQSPRIIRPSNRRMRQSNSQKAVQIHNPNGIQTSGMLLTSKSILVSKPQYLHYEKVKSERKKKNKSRKSSSNTNTIMPPKLKSEHQNQDIFGEEFRQPRSK